MTTIADRLWKVREMLNCSLPYLCPTSKPNHRCLCCQALAELPDPDAVGRDMAELEKLRGWKMAWDAGGQPTVDKMIDERNVLKQRVRELEEAAPAKLEEKHPPQYPPIRIDDPESLRKDRSP